MKGRVDTSDDIEYRGGSAPQQYPTRPLKGKCKVKIDKAGNGDITQLLTMPDGTVIPGQVWSRVYGHCNTKDHPSYAIVKFYIDFEDKEISEAK